MTPSPPTLRILLVNRSLPSHVPGGLERHVEDLAFGLAERGCEVHLLTAPLTPSERERIESRGLIHHAIPQANPRRYTLRYLAGVGRHLRRLIDRYRFDLIHAQEFALGMWRPRSGDPPIVLTVHGTMTSETPLHPDAYRYLDAMGRIRAWIRYGRRYLYTPVWRALLRRADRILVDSAFTRGELARIAPECQGKVRLIPLAVREFDAEPPSYDQARQALGWRGIHLITIGRMEWQKGYDLALQALAMLKDLDWRYVMVGVGSYSGRIHRWVDDLGLRDRIILRGRISQTEKNRMLAGADLFLWPERTHPAFGLVGLESMLHSTPALATRRGAIPEVLGEEGGWLVDRIEPHALAEALRPLLTDPSTLRAARERLRASAIRRFSFAAMVEAILAEYQSVVRSQ